MKRLVRVVAMVGLLAMLPASGLAATPPPADTEAPFAQTEITSLCIPDETRVDQVIAGGNISEGSGRETEGIGEREATTTSEIEQLAGIFQSIISELEKYSDGAITITTPEQSLKIEPQGTGSCLSLNITSGPYLLVDSNKPGVEGPMVATMSAVVNNTGANTTENVFVYIGDGTTPGNFTAGSDGNNLTMLGGIGDATRYIVNLDPGESKTIFWQLAYPATYSQTYSFTVWADNDAGCSASDSHNVTTRSALSASANKLLGTITLSPSSGVVNAGNLLTVNLTGFNFGLIGAGPNGEEDAWGQPVGNLGFNASCFRLVRTKVYIHSIENVAPYNGMPLIDQVYLTGIRSTNPPPNYSYNSADYIEYTFIALSPCSTTLKPYNEVASGTQEKYSGDYDESGTTINVTSLSGNLTFSKSADPTTAEAGDNITWTITYGNASNYTIGDPDTGNGLVVLDEAIPNNTTYLAGTANCSAECIIFYSTDGGTNWTTTEPAAENVTAIKWYINEVIPANTNPAGTASFQTTVDVGTPPDTLICNTAQAKIDEGDPLVSDTVCVNAPVPVCNITCDPADCADCNQVNLTVNPSGGTEPYTYLWSTNETSQSINVTSSGNYSVNVTDDNDCTTSCNKTVTIYPTPACNITAPSGVCENSTGNSANTNSGYDSYNWTITNGTITSANNTFNITWDAGGTSPATLNVTVTDGACTATCSKDVTVVEPCNATAPDFSICVNMTLDDDLFTGEGANCTGPACCNMTLNYTGVSNTTAGNYTYSVTCACDGVCPPVNATGNVTVNALPICTIMAPASVCENSTGNSANTSSGYDSYSWTITNGTITSANNTFNITWDAGGTSPVTLNVTITDADNCTSSCNKTVTVYPTPSCNITCDPSGCAHSDQVTLTINPTGGTGPYTYLWSTNETSQFINVTTTGNYSVTVTDAHNCTNTCNQEVTITPVPTCAIGDTVFYDNNGDGKQDPGEPGIAGVQLDLYRDDGNGVFNPSGGTDEFVASRITDATGKYEFTGLNCSATYWVYVVHSTLPPGLTLTTGGDPWGPITLTEGEVYDLADFGYRPPIPVGGEVYPVNKLAILMPWIAVAVLLAGGISWLTLRRRRAQS